MMSLTIKFGDSSLDISFSIMLETLNWFLYRSGGILGMKKFRSGKAPVLLWAFDQHGLYATHRALTGS